MVFRVIDLDLSNLPNNNIFSIIDFLFPNSQVIARIF